MGILVGGGREGSIISQEEGNKGKEPRLKDVFPKAGAGVEGDERVGWMWGTEYTG